MAISSNTLFQFTGNFETLKSILSCGYIWPRYCTEFCWGGYSFALPMACFCDIPLSQISSHVQFYGNYGIGLSKSWSDKQKGIASVLYTKPSSQVANHVAYMLKKWQKEPFNLNTEDFILLSRIKKYSGETYSKKENRFVKRCFYNEREWRYIPKGMLPNNCFVKHGKQKIKFDEHLNDKFKDELIFSANDIKYLIVSTEAEREKLIYLLFNDKLLGRASKEERTLAMYKILTVKQIQEDF